jgi:hypothetical protein
MPLSAGWNKLTRFAVVDLHRSQRRPYPFMVLSDAIVVYNF